MKCLLCDSTSAAFKWSDDIHLCFKCRDRIIRTLDFSQQVLCKYCDNAIAFVRTENNKTMPIDPQPTLEGGTIIDHRGKTIKDAAPGLLGFHPHFISCTGYNKKQARTK